MSIIKRRLKTRVDSTYLHVGLLVLISRYFLATGEFHGEERVDFLCCIKSSEIVSSWNPASP